MTQQTLKSFSIATTLFVFFMIFASGLVLEMDSKYDVSNDLNNPQLSIYAGDDILLQQQVENVEDSGDAIKLRVVDIDVTKSTITQFKDIFTIRSNIEDAQRKNQEILSFIPKKVWTMIWIVISTIIAYLIAGLFWRYKQGLH